MPVLVLYGVLFAAPAATLLAAGHVLERWCAGYARPVRAREVARGPSLERLAADLRRLQSDYRRIHASDLPGRVSRMRTVTLAYDDVLRSCCTVLGLPEPGSPLSTLDRLQTEAALAQHGLSW